MNSTFRALFSLLLLMALVGCSSQAFRNREMDYTKTPVQKTPGLQTPKGLAAPALQPTLTIPDGPNVYPAGSPPNLTPPGYSQVIPVPPKPIKAPKVSNS